VAEPVHPAAPPSDGRPRRVRHQLFGEGIVLRESGSGDALKLEVEFPEAGRKVLLARFLEYLP